MKDQRMTIASVQSLYQRREISPYEVAGLYRSRIQTLEPQLNSCISLMDSWETEAKEAEKSLTNPEASPLTGIPIVIKDNICTKGTKTTCASKMLDSFVPPYSATAVQRLNAHKPVGLAKTNMDEFAMGGSGETSFYGPTKNPYDLDRVPGGSSSGTAAAVSAGLCVAGLGSDTGGSIRQPAAFCGVTGLKPTYGRVSRYGLVAFASSLDQIGPIANSAEDCGILLGAIAGPDPYDGTTAPRKDEDYTALIGKSLAGTRIAVLGDLMGEAVSDPVRRAVEEAIRFYQDMGAQITTISMEGLEKSIAAYYLISSAEASSNLSRYDGVKYGYRTAQYESAEEMVRKTRMEGFGDEVKRRILLGTYALCSGYYDDYYKKAVYLKESLKQQYYTIFQDYDAILAPTAPTTAYKLGEQIADPVQMYSADICTVTVNLAGLPAISTPCAYYEGLPIGMTLIGRPWEEAKIIQLADCFERSFSWQPPALWEVSPC